MSSRRARSRLRQDQRLADSFQPRIVTAMRAERDRILEASTVAGARAAVSLPQWKATLGTLWLSDPVLEFVVDQSVELDGPSEVSRETREVLTRIAHSHAESIADQQRDLIETIVATALDSSKAFRSTERRRIREEYNQLIDRRGGRVAFTEALQASETAKYEGARQAPLSDTTQLLKVWFTVGDSKVRPTHSAANGQSRVVTARRGGQAGMFRVGGALLEHPRDPNGPAEEVINCRCFLEYRRRRRRTR